MHWIRMHGRQSRRAPDAYPLDVGIAHVARSTLMSSDIAHRYHRAIHGVARALKIVRYPRMEMTTMPDLDRRHFLGAAAATIATSQLGLIAFPRRLEAMTGTLTDLIA